MAAGGDGGGGDGGDWDGGGDVGAGPLYGEDRSRSISGFKGCLIFWAIVSIALILLFVAASKEV